MRATVGPAVRKLYVLLAILALLLAGMWIATGINASNLRKETAKRLKAAEATTVESTTQVKALVETARQLQAKVAVLESKQQEAQSQQLALEQLYQDLSKNRDDWALAEIEQVLSTASQQLQLAGNIQGALIALQNADSRLSRADRPQFIAIRRAVARDIDRLKAVPSLDLTGIALRLDSIIGQIDQMPLLADEKPIVPTSEPKTSMVTQVSATDDNVGSAWFQQLENTWQRWSSELWAEVQQLIRVRSVAEPDALLLSPTQAYYARENLKLRLLNARLALLSRNESAFRSDLIAAQETIGKYFDTRARQTQTAQSLLRQVQGSNLAIELPTLAESLNAVRNYKVKP
ncbi:MAG: uroporphyrinogen-III C-methyltransferase [Pseudomonadota bacterium]